MTAQGGDFLLDGIRQEIDAIDDGIVDLLIRRIAAAQKVRASKTMSGSLAGSPIRPAREALILRRLIDAAGKEIPAELLVRLWRVILSSSTMSQAPVTVHISRDLESRTDLRIAVAEHFAAMPVECHDHEAAAVAALASVPGDLCVVEPQSPWVEAYIRGLNGRAQVIGAIPVLRKTEHPALLVLGHTVAQPTGDDETLILSQGRLPREIVPAPRWTVRNGNHVLSCLPGFIGETDGLVTGLMRSNPALSLRVAGNYPSPIEMP